SELVVHLESLNHRDESRPEVVEQRRKSLARASVGSSACPRASRGAVPTCPACYKQSRKPEKFNYVYHRVLRRVGIGYFRCTHCDAYYFGFPWYEWGWFRRLRSMTRSWTRRAPVERTCPNCGQNRIHRSHRQSIG